MNFYSLGKINWLSNRHVIHITYWRKIHRFHMIISLLLHFSSCYSFHSILHRKKSSLCGKMSLCLFCVRLNDVFNSINFRQNAIRELSEYILFEWFFACDWFSNQSIKNKSISNVMLKEIQNNGWKTLLLVAKADKVIK